MDPVDEVFFKEDCFSTGQQLQDVEVEYKVPLGLERLSVSDEEDTSLGPNPSNLEASQTQAKGNCVIPASLPAHALSDSRLDSTEETWHKYGRDSRRVEKPVGPPTVLDDYCLTDSDNSWRQYDYERMSVSTGDSVLVDITELREDSQGNLPLLNFDACSLETSMGRPSLNAKALKELPDCTHDGKGWIIPKEEDPRHAVPLPLVSETLLEGKNAELSLVNLTVVQTPKSSHQTSGESLSGMSGTQSVDPPQPACTPEALSCTSAKEIDSQSCRCSGGTHCNKSHFGATSSVKQKASTRPGDLAFSPVEQQSSESPMTPGMKNIRMNSQELEEYYANKTEKFQIEVCKQVLKDPNSSPSSVFEQLTDFSGMTCMYGGRVNNARLGNRGMSFCIVSTVMYLLPPVSKLLFGFH
jgi:hypothetical protein